MGTENEQLIRLAHGFLRINDHYTKICNLLLQNKNDARHVYSAENASLVITLPTTIVWRGATYKYSLLSCRVGHDTVPFLVLMFQITLHVGCYHWIPRQRTDPVFSP